MREYLWHDRAAFHFLTDVAKAVHAMRSKGWGHAVKGHRRVKCEADNLPRALHTLRARFIGLPHPTSLKITQKSYQPHQAHGDARYFSSIKCGEGPEDAPGRRGASRDACR